MRVGRFVDVESVHDVPEPQHRAGPEHIVQPVERDRLPEVGQVVQRVPAVGEVDEVTLVLVREEAGVHALDVGEPAFVDAARSRASMTGDTSTATTRRHLGAAASVNCPVPAPRSSTVEAEFMPSSSSRRTSAAASASSLSS